MSWEGGGGRTHLVDETADIARQQVANAEDDELEREHDQGQHGIEDLRDRDDQRVEGVEETVLAEHVSDHVPADRTQEAVEQREQVKQSSRQVRRNRDQHVEQHGEDIGAEAPVRRAHVNGGLDDLEDV